MSFTQALTEAVERSAPRFPIVERIANALSSEDRVAFYAALDNPETPTTAIAAALRRLGYTISPERLGAYRRSLR